MPGKLCYTDVSTCYSEWIWDILERGLKEGVLGAVPPEALGCLVFDLPQI